jgi:hypothetical protein
MKTLQTVIRISIIIAILSLVTAGLGVFWQGQGEPIPFTTMRGETVSLYGRGLYRFDTVSIAAQGIAQDAVTLLLGIPLLITGIVLARKGSLRGQLLLTGTLGYFLYTYTSYVFLAAFNQLFLLYVALFSLALFAFILAMIKMKPEVIVSQFSDKFPLRGVAIFMMILAGFLAMSWLGRIVPATIAGTPPIGLESYTTLVIQGLDLGIIVPVSALTAILLWRSRPWGYALAAVVLVKGLTMGAALIAMIVSQILAGFAVSMVEIIMFAGIAIAALVFTIIMFRSVQEPK